VHEQLSAHQLTGPLGGRLMRGHTYADYRFVSAWGNEELALATMAGRAGHWRDWLCKECCCCCCCCCCCRCRCAVRAHSSRPF